MSRAMNADVSPDVGDDDDKQRARWVVERVRRRQQPEVRERFDGEPDARLEHQEEDHPWMTMGTAHGMMMAARTHRRP